MNPSRSNRSRKSLPRIVATRSGSARQRIAAIGNLAVAALNVIFIWKGAAQVEKYHIELTAEESSLLSQIDLRTTHASHDEGHAAYNANMTPILALVRSLSERRAVPRERLNYWNEPTYNPGRIKASRKGLFERNRCVGEEIYTHPHFLPHLRYFLFGADLPDEVIATFEEGVGNPEWVTSSDILQVGKLARDLTRRHGLEKSAAADEFFKLCLDMGLGLNTACSVMRAVQQIRSA